MQTKKQKTVELLKRAGFRAQDALDEIEEMERQSLRDILIGISGPVYHLHKALSFLEEITQEKPAPKIREK